MSWNLLSAQATLIILVIINSSHPSYGFAPTPKESCCLELKNGKPIQDIAACNGLSLDVKQCEEITRAMSEAIIQYQKDVEQGIPGNINNLQLGQLPKISDVKLSKDRAPGTFSTSTILEKIKSNLFFIITSFFCILFGFMVFKKTRRNNRIFQWIELLLLCLSAGFAVLASLPSINFVRHFLEKGNIGSVREGLYLIILWGSQFVALTLCMTSIFATLKLKFDNFIFKTFKTLLFLLLITLMSINIYAAYISFQ